jgi:hypothetical protein
VDYAYIDYSETAHPKTTAFPVHAVKEDHGRQGGLGFTVVTGCGKTLHHARKGLSSYREIVTCLACRRTRLYTED